MADVCAAVAATSLPDCVQRALCDLAERPGPGTWSRLRFTRGTPTGTTLDRLWRAVAPIRTRRTRLHDWIEAMSRARPMEPMVSEAMPLPETPQDVWDFVAYVLTFWPKRATGTTGTTGAAGATDLPGAPDPLSPP